MTAEQAKRVARETADLGGVPARVVLKRDGRWAVQLPGVPRRPGDRLLCTFHPSHPNGTSRVPSRTPRRPMPFPPRLYLDPIDGPVREVADVREALSLAGGDPIARDGAGDAWWLVMAYCPAEAADQADNLRCGWHADQDAIAAVHADIANGLDPDLSPLVPTTVRPDLPRIRTPHVNPR